MCLAEGHNVVTPVRLEPGALWSQVNHSTTGPLCSHTNNMDPDQTASLISVEIINAGNLIIFSFFETKADF